MKEGERLPLYMRYKAIKRARSEDILIIASSSLVVPDRVSVVVFLPTPQNRSAAPSFVLRKPVRRWRIPFSLNAIVTLVALILGL